LSRFSRHALPILLFLVLVALPVRGASARTRPQLAGSGAIVPTPLLPPAGARIDEATARFEITPGTGITNVRVVVAHFPFEPAGWSSLPTGPAWTVVSYRAQPIALQSLGVVDRTDTKLWWAVVWTDARTGVMHGSEVRDLMVVPRFANRAGSAWGLHPSATGRLPERVAALGLGARRPIELAAGYKLVPGGPAPVVPAALKQLRPVPVSASAPQAYLVQFADDAPDADRARIKSVGGEIVAPISGGYLVRMNAEANARLQKAAGQPFVAPFEPAYKLSPTLDLSSTSRVEVTALLFMDGDGDKVVASLHALGATNLASHRSELNHLVRFGIDPSKLADAAALTDVAWIEPTDKFSFKNDKAQWVVQSGVENSRPVTDHGLRGQGQIVMISDSGIRTNHEMFNDSTQAINGWGDYPTHRKIIAYKPAVSDAVFGDDPNAYYHGTHTSGTIVGDPSPFSAARWLGMARDARLYFVDAGKNDGGVYTPDDLNDLYQPSYTGNLAGAARISSNSWGSTVNVGYYTLASMQTDQFVWNHPDYLIAFAAGNYGVFSSIEAPGTAKNLLTVGAVGNGTAENTWASFSSRGPTRDGRRKPTVMGPGDLVTSSVGNTRYTYGTYSGTSMATPAVAGAMALVRQYLTQGWYPTGAPIAANAIVPSAALMRAIAVNSGRNDITSFRVPDNSIGYGRLTLDDVLYFPGDSSRTQLVDSRDGLSDQQFVEYQVQVMDPSRPLKIALCWTDPPATPASQVAIVNDLDLVVTHNGSTYRGNYLLNYNSAAGGTRDSLNVEELVRLAAPGAGLWTVRVEGHHVVQGPQPFALCITGGVGGPAGAIALDRFQYGLKDTLQIEVIDTDATGPLTAQVTSSTEPLGQNVILTGSNGVFHGSIPIAPVLAQTGDGVLAVSSGDLVTATYTGASPPVQVVSTARVNVQAATITNVHAAAGATQATITWTTDVAASSTIRFGTGALASVATASGYSTQHSVLVTGLHASTTYRYDVESTTPVGAVSVDSLGGLHRAFTTNRAGSIALLMDDPSTSVLDTWANAFAALGWNVDVLAAAGNDPPLVGNTSAGLRSYQAVMWQVGPDNYPPFSDAQRAAIDSLLNFGGRLLVTGHDIGWGLSDAGAPSYTPEREAWIESGLKTRYFADNLNADTLTGVAGSPVSGAFTTPVPCPGFYLYPDAGDAIGAAPGTDGVWSGDWTENYLKGKNIGMHWESNSAKGTSGLGVWGGQKSRLVGMFYEWRGMASTSTASVDARTGAMRDAVSYLLGHSPPEVHITAPAPGAVVTGDYLSIRYSIRADVGRAISSHSMDYSLDGGASWAPALTAVCADSGCIWDLAASLGGAPTPNSTNVMLRVRMTDDGSPALSATAVMSGPFALARPSGDTRGPVLVAGSAACSPLPVRRGQPATLTATFTDAETGGGTIAAAEYSAGPLPAPAGGGTAMTGAFGSMSVQASAALATNNLSTGNLQLWLRARDASGNWGAASTLTVPTTGSASATGVGDPIAVDFLATPSPNPFRGLSTIRFGLARACDVRLELFDVAGRQVQTLVSGAMAAGPHVAIWNGRDLSGNVVKNGVYFVRLTTPSKQWHTRVVALQ